MSCDNNYIKKVEEIQAEIDLSDQPILSAIIFKFNSEIELVQNLGEYDFDIINIATPLDDIIKTRITNKTILLIDQAGYKVKQDQDNLLILHLTWEIKTNIDKLIL